MPQEHFQRKVGVVSCAVLLAFTLYLFFILARDVHTGPHYLRARFPEVGTLILQEPVSMEGVQVGRVAGIDYSPGTAVVTLEFYRRLSLPRDSRIINFNHSLMGSRMIFIERGASMDKMNFQIMQDGEFQAGIAEMLDEADTLLTMTRRLWEFYSLQVLGAGSKPSLREVYSTALVPGLQSVSTLLDLARTAEVEILDRLDRADALLARVEGLIRHLEGSLPAWISHTTHLLEQTDTLVASLNALAETSTRSLDLVIQPGGLFHRLVYDSEDYENLVRLSRDINALTTALRNGEVANFIKFWRNVHILGPNPTRRSQRMAF